MDPVALLKWLHILCMVGTIGVLLAAQVCSTPEQRNSPTASRATARLANILLGIGLLAGFAYYFLTDGMTRGAHYNGVIGMKFVFLLGAGALIGISKRTDRGDSLRWIAFGLLVSASLFGVTLTAVP